MAKKRPHSRRRNEINPRNISLNIVELDFLMTPEAGRLFKEKRVRLNMTQIDAAEALGVGQATISRLETLPGQCRLQNVIKAMSIYKIRWSDIHVSVVAESH